MTRRSRAPTAGVVAALAGLLACGCTGESAPRVARGATKRVSVDGSSTLGPLLDVARQLFQAARPDVEVQLATSGTSAGFRRFLADSPEQRVDVCKASRPIAPEEIERAARLGIELIEIPIAYDGIALVVHPSNAFCDYLTREELRRIWEPDSRIVNWKDVRPGFPDVPLKLFGAGPQSGTFDVFTTVVVGKVKSSRRDYIASESDNALVGGVAGEPGALGYFGSAYLEANRDKLRDVAIAESTGSAPVRLTPASVRDGSYALARPTFLYVSAASAQRQEVSDFVDFILRDARGIVEHARVRSIALPDDLYREARRRLEQRVVGSAYADPAAHAKSLRALFLGEPQ